MGKVWEIDTHTFPIVLVLLYHPISILWYTPAYEKCMDFPINLPKYGKMQQNPCSGGKSGKLTLILFPECGFFFPVRFLSYGILHYMGNAWVSPSISHSTGKCKKTHRMGRTCEIGAPTFLIVWTLFFH